MERVIKFRAWYGEKMHIGFTFNGISSYSSYEGGSGYVLAFDNSSVDCTDDDKLIWMQFTGLLDKNGKEIWEGDIVRIKECECIGHSADGTEEEWSDCEGEVSFEDGVFVFEGHSAGALPLFAYKGAVEVIGNIYENPDLLQ